MRLFLADSFGALDCLEVIAPIEVEIEVFRLQRPPNLDYDYCFQRDVMTIFSVRKTL